MSGTLMLTEGVVLSGLDLTGAEIRSVGPVRLDGCRLTRCDLRGLRDATIIGCILDDCQMPDSIQYLSWPFAERTPGRTKAPRPHEEDGVQCRAGRSGLVAPSHDDAAPVAAGSGEVARQGPEPRE